MQIQHWFRVSVFLAATFAASSAMADRAPSPPPPPNQSGHHYNFDDDPLDAGDVGPLVSRIAVSMRASRATLIRPRTAFVAELLKSVEHL